VLVQDLITLVLKDIGVVAKTEVPTPDELNDAFTTANMMLDSWAIDRLMIFQNVRSVYPLVSGQQFYAIGQSGSPDFNAVRPIWIQDAGIIQAAYTPNFELPVRILTIDEWASLTIKNQPATQSWYLYNDYAYPNSNLALWPVPSVSTLQLALYVPTPLTQFTSVTSTLSVPPGYLAALRWNLAVWCCPMFSKQIDPVVGKLAGDSLAAVQRANKRLDTLGVDDALVGGVDRGIFNYLTGQSTGMRNT